MSEPVDVQAERLRELAAAATPGPWENAPDTAAGRVWVRSRAHMMDCEPGFPWSFAKGLFKVRSHRSTWNDEERQKVYKQREADAAFIAACDPQTVLSLLDLLAGQAEQIEQLKKERYEAQLGWQNAQSATYDSHLAAVCQRDNLRDAAEQMMRRAQLATNGVGDNQSAVVSIEDWREFQAALRAAAVGEGSGEGSVGGSGGSGRLLTDALATRPSPGAAAVGEGE